MEQGLMAHGTAMEVGGPITARVRTVRAPQDAIRPMGELTELALAIEQQVGEAFGLARRLEEHVVAIGGDFPMANKKAERDPAPPLGDLPTVAALRVQSNRLSDLLRDLGEIASRLEALR